MYRPADAGVPSYFKSMLFDVDKERKYRAAIAALLADLASHAPGRKLRVLDFGCGTGLLGSLVLLEAAAQSLPVHVIFLDLNPTMLDSAEWEIGQMDSINGTSYEFVCGTCTPGRRAMRGVRISDESVDALVRAPISALTSLLNASFTLRRRLLPFVQVSEILGTFSVSESMHVYLADAAKLVTPRGGKKHVIPSAVTQFAEVYDEAILVPNKAELSERHAVGLYRRLGPNLHLVINRQPEFDTSLRPLATAVVRTDRFSSSSAYEYEGEPLVTIDHAFCPNHILAFTWQAHLWGTSVIHNTFQAANPARMQAWGIPFTFILPHEAEDAADACLDIRWPKADTTPRRLSLRLNGAALPGVKRLQTADGSDLLDDDSEPDDDDDDYSDPPYKRKRK